MKKLVLLITVAMLSLSSAFAQSVEGAWGITFTNSEGQEMFTVITFSADSYTVDFGADDAPEVEGSYTIADGQITVQDTGGNPDFMCPAGAKGVYKVDVTDDQLTMTLVSDECEGRGNGGAMVFSRQ